MGEHDNDEPTEASDGTRKQDADATEVNPGNDYTEYEATDTGDSAAGATVTGFDRARQMAQKAQAESGRLLKKRFVLEDVLGEGGMGLVYKARDLRKVEAEDRNPYIAVKVLGQQFKEHPQAFVSLQQEAVKSQKLAHPNIVTVHDFDRDGNTIFMTMELLKGDPLDALIRLEAPFSKETALRYFRELCAGLEYAHKRDLIHSDFKPGNIFVTTGGTVKILDFGIARAANKNALSHDWDVGDLGALTPAYATVEMVRGEPPSTTDDVYALACVLYLMLTGEHPYERKSAMDAQKEKLKPARPECLNNREWQALLAGLSTDRGKRPATIAAFRDALLPPARASRLKGLALAGVVLLVAGGWLGYQQYSSQQAQAAAVQQRLQAAKDCYINQDYPCVIENALVVRNLAGDNQQAADLLARAQQAQAEAEERALISRRLEEGRECLEAADYGCARVKAREVLAARPGDAQAQALLDSAARESARAAMQEHLAEATACLDEGDTACAGEALADAEAAGASAADLYPVQRRLDTLLESEAAVQAEREARVQAYLTQARDCLERADFACSEARLEEALALDPGNTAAVQLQQSVVAAREQRRFNEQTVNRFLDAARTCLTRKDYSCTIAKSESALAIIPGYGPAESLIDEARSAQRKAKMNISIE